MNCAESAAHHQMRVLITRNKKNIISKINNCADYTTMQTLINHLTRKQATEQLVIIILHFGTFKCFNNKYIMWCHLKLRQRLPWLVIRASEQPNSTPCTSYFKMSTSSMFFAECKESRYHLWVGSSYLQTPIVIFLSQNFLKLSCILLASMPVCLLDHAAIAFQKETSKHDGLLWVVTTFRTGYWTRNDQNKHNGTLPPCFKDFIHTRWAFFKHI